MQVKNRAEARHNVYVFCGYCGGNRFACFEQLYKGLRIQKNYVKPVVLEMGEKLRKSRPAPHAQSRTEYNTSSFHVKISLFCSIL